MKNQELEALFMQTIDQPELMTKFLKELLIADIYCIGDDSDQSNILFRMLETPEDEQAIPFFLTADTLKMSFGDDLEYFIMPAKHFFEMTKGSTLLLNPASAYMKEFTSDEIDFLLSFDIP